MLKNGKNIYDTLNMFSNIPIQVVNDKMSKIFNTDNEIKNIFLNDVYIQHLQNYAKYDKSVIIKHILFCLQPIIHQDSKNINVNEYKTIIEQTLNFKLNFMKDINTQLDFIFNPNTCVHIQIEINNSIKGDKQIDINYIHSILKNKIDTHIKNKKELNYSNVIIKYNIYINQATLFTEREIFDIIHGTIDSITKKINVENNNIIQHKNMNKWNTVLGHNNNDIKQTMNIKLNNKRPSGMQFNMNY